MTKKSLLIVVLSTVLMSAMLFSATPIGVIPVSAQLPARCPELHLQAQAETYANGDYDFAQGYYDPVTGFTRAYCDSHWLYQGPGLSMTLGAMSDVYVWQDPLGNVWGPCQVNQGRLVVWASAMYVPPPAFPSLEAYTEARYYSDGAPFIMNCPQRSEVSWITGGQSSAYVCTGGMRVEDDGNGIIYDVAFEVGGVHGFRLIENVGNWPGPWQVNYYPLGDGRSVIRATLAPYQFNVPVAGCAQATFYLNLTYTPPPHESSLSGIHVAEITNDESEVEDRYEATFNVPSVGGIVEFPRTEELGTAIPDLSGHNYALWAAIVAGTVIGIITGTAWYIRRRRTKAT